MWVNILNIFETDPVVELAETWQECSRKLPLQSSFGLFQILLLRVSITDANILDCNA